MKKGISSIVFFITFILMAFVAPMQTWAVWSNDPAVNTLISTGPDYKDLPQIASDGNGGAIITWEAYNYSSTNYTIYAQRIGADGNVKWTANGVAIATVALGGNPPKPQIVSDVSEGVIIGAIITWQDYRNGNADIYAQKIDAEGNVKWTANGVVISAASGAQLGPKIVSDYSGGAIITWQDERNGRYDIYAQRIDDSGAVQWTANGIKVTYDSNSWNQMNPAIIADMVGVIITWQDDRTGGGSIYAQKIDIIANRLWGLAGVAVYSGTGGYYPTIADDGNGGAIITWMDTRNTDYNIFAQRIAANGTIQWTANGVAISTAAGTQYQNPLQITSDGSGGAIITWQDYRSGNYDIYAQKIAANGTVQWTTNGVAISTATGSQIFPQLVGDGSGGAIMTWGDLRSGYDIYAQKVISNGTLAMPYQLLYADLAGYGIYGWDGSIWSQLNGISPAKMVACGANLYADLGAGIWQWNGTAWSRLNGISPTSMVASGSNLYAYFGTSGIWQWNGSAWSQLNGISPTSMVASGSNLYAYFGASGIWQWNGAAWNQLNGISPAKMVASGSNLYADISGSGIWEWNGVAWSQLNGISPTSMVASGSKMYADFSAGIWQWNGSAWSQLNGMSPAKMVASGSKMYADLGSGIWQWNGSAWNQLNGISPASMVAYGSNLYANIAGSGIWQWNGAAWSQLNGISPASMVAGF